MSNSTERKVKRIIIAWNSALCEKNRRLKQEGFKPDRKLTFVTLTLSDKQIHDDNWIKREMLNRFLIEMKRHHNVSQYLWRAEKMQNGRIHFHILLDCYVDSRVLQDVWNDIQRDKGYLDYFYSRFNRYNAPSTHVRIVDSTEKAIDYTTKYVSKDKSNDKNEKLKVQGRIWGCSDEIRNIRVFSESENQEVITEIFKQKNEGRLKVIEDDFFVLVLVNTERFIRERFLKTYDAMLDYYFDLYKSVYDKQYMCQMSKCYDNEQITKKIKNRVKWIQGTIKGFELYDSHTNH